MCWNYGDLGGEGAVIGVMGGVAGIRVIWRVKVL